MSWNYRVFEKAGAVKKRNELGALPPFFFVGECYYDTNGEPQGYSDMTHNIASGGSVEDIKETLKMVSDALKEPVIKLDVDGGIVVQ